MWKNSKTSGLVVLFLFLSILAISNSFAQEKYPNRPITFIINYPPGGPIDVSYRPLLEAASKILGQPLVPVNKPGASGTLGPATLKTVKPDGYTLSVGHMTLLAIPHMQDAAYDPLKDFTYIIRTHAGQFGIVVKSDSPWKTLKDLVEYAKQHPNEIKYSTSSPGSIHHFAMEEIAMKEKVKWKIVPYPGGPQAIMALLGGHVQVSSQDTAWVPYVLSGQLRLLAVFGDKMKEFPDAPTLRELGYTPWYWPLGVIGPAGMEKSVVKIVHDAFKEAIKDPVFLRTCDNLQFPTLYLNSEDFDRYMRESYIRIGNAIRMVGLGKKN